MVRIGPNELSFSSPDAALDIFRTGKGFQKTGFYTIFLPDETPDIFTEIRERVHAKKKRFAVPPYSLASVKLQTEQIEVLISDLLSIMDSVAIGNEARAFDLGSYLHYFVFDVSASHACPFYHSQFPFLFFLFFFFRFNVKAYAGPCTICVRQALWVFEEWRRCRWIDVWH